jgi:hypothetical protein
LFSNTHLCRSCCLLYWLVLVVSVHAQQSEPLRSESAVARGQAFLVKLLEPDLNLLPEFAGHDVIWLFHDNYLAAKVLEKSHPEISKNIMTAIRSHGVTRSGKIEMLFGEAKLPLYTYELRDVAKVGRFAIRSEFTTDQVRQDVANYADLLLFSVLGQEDRVAAEKQWQATMKMWDGNGFRDKAAEHMQLYATYKLALAMIVARRCDFADSESQRVLTKVREQLFSMQSENGGWITDYRLDGSKVGFANVETTCLAVMAIQE